MCRILRGHCMRGLEYRSRKHNRFTSLVLDPSEFALDICGDLVIVRGGRVMIDGAWGSGSFMCQKTLIHTVGLNRTVCLHEICWRLRCYCGAATGPSTKYVYQSRDVIHPFWGCPASCLCPVPPSSPPWHPSCITFYIAWAAVDSGRPRKAFWVVSRSHVRRMGHGREL